MCGELPFLDFLSIFWYNMDVMCNSREKALEILCFIFEAWDSSWKNAKLSLGNLNLSEGITRRLTFFETEQRRTTLGFLARLFVAWDSENEADFSASVVSLASELRPAFWSLETDPEEGIMFSDSQASVLRFHSKQVAGILKSAVSDLKALPAKSAPAPRSASFGFIAEGNYLVPAPEPTAPEDSKPLTLERAETLIREKLGLSFFDFLEWNTEPDFHAGYFPALLQESTDLGF